MGDRLLAGLVVVPFLLGAAAAPTSPARVACTFQDPEIVESSGLVAQDGLFLTTNDSGDSGRVFAVDPATGSTVGLAHWSEDPTDVEALAPARDGGVWVGDIGDNTGSRDSVEVTRVPVTAADTTVDGETYELDYPDGPHNAESLLSDPRTGRLYVATKSVFGGTVYRAPRTLSADGPNRLRPVGDVLAIATDGAFFPDGRHVVLRDYSHAVVYTFPDLHEVALVPAADAGAGGGDRGRTRRVGLRQLGGPAPAGPAGAAAGRRTSSAGPARPRAVGRSLAGFCAAGGRHRSEGPPVRPAAGLAVVPHRRARPGPAGRRRQGLRATSARVNRAAVAAG